MIDKEIFNSWVKGWMLGKYCKFVAPEADEDWQQWVDGFIMGQTEMCEYERWILNLQKEIKAHPELKPTLEHIALEPDVSSHLSH